MSNLKHTKGEWIYQDSTQGDVGIYCKGHGYICFLPQVRKFENQQQRYIDELKEAEANAKLIAAAPDMLEALKEANAELENLRSYASKARNQILENDVMTVSHIGIDGLDDIMLTSNKCKKAIKKATL